MGVFLPFSKKLMDFRSAPTSVLLEELTSSCPSPHHLITDLPSLTLDWNVSLWPVTSNLSHRSKGQALLLPNRAGNGKAQEEIWCNPQNMSCDGKRSVWAYIYISQVVMEKFILYYLSAAFPNWEMEASPLSNKNKLCSRAIMLLLKECELSLPVRF